MQIGQLYVARKEEEMAREERKLTRQVYGYEPTQRPEDSIQRVIIREREARDAGELFFIGN